MTSTIPADNRSGLTTAEAQARLMQFGPNAVVEDKAHPVRQIVKRFWAPIAVASGSHDHHPALPR